MPEDNQPKAKTEEAADDSSLEQVSTQANADDSQDLEKSADSKKPDKSDKPVGPNINWRERIIRQLGNFNPYLVLFILILVMGGVIALISNRLNRQNDPSNLVFEDGQLTEEEFEQLRRAEQNIGTVDQTLTVAANTIFNGKVLVKSDLDVAGSIRVGGPLNLPGITVAGDSDFENISVNNNLAVLGNASIQGALTVQGAASFSNNVSVAGTISANEISADVINFTGDLQLTGHVNTSGSTPTAVAGSGVGGGGTVSVSGNDIAGTATINTGGGPSANTLIRVNFRNTYSGTPVVMITPVGSAASNLRYYVARDSAGFSIATSNAPSASTTYRFDYFVVE